MASRVQIDPGAQSLKPDQAFDIMKYWRDNPAQTCIDLLGYDPWSMQTEILNALALPRNRVAVKAAHSVGKTSLAAMALYWRVMTGGVVLSTAPTWSQVKNVLWREVRTTYAKHKDKIGGELLSVELKIDPNCYALGLSTNEGVNFQGHHGDILVIIDEAPGVRHDIYEAIEGIRAGGDVTVLALGNPTTVGNEFHSAFLTEGNDTGWDLFTIPAFATPNFARFPNIEAIQNASLEDRLRVPRPYLTNPQWVLEKYNEWGENSPMYQSRILANFPTFSEFSLISMSWIMAAVDREIREKEAAKQQLVVGIDVAGQGEAETVLYARRDNKIIHLATWVDEDPVEDVLETLTGLREQNSDVDMRVRIDSAGVGHYFALAVKHAGFNVEPVNVGVSPIAKPLKKIPKYGATVTEQSKDLRFANLKAQLYWQLREVFRWGNITGLTDEQTQGQLATIQYTTSDQGKIEIEKKSDMRKRGLKSPDRAEALMLCFGDLTEMATSGKIYRPVIVMKGMTGNWFGTDNSPINDSH